MQALGESATGAGTTLVKTANENHSVGSHRVTPRRLPNRLRPERGLAIACQNEVEGEVRRDCSRDVTRNHFSSDFWRLGFFALRLSSVGCPAPGAQEMCDSIR
jgi:hypothetical protein